MLFMIIERFKDRDPKPIYRHLRGKGRGLPEGLEYIDSWIEPSVDRCFQLMECDEARLPQEWILHWGELAAFEIVPVVPSKQTRELVESKLADPE